MRRPPLGIIALVIISAVTDFIAASFFRGQVFYSWPAEYFMWGLTLSQNSLLWTWAILGRSRFVVRFTVAMIAMLGLTRLLTLGTSISGRADWVIVLLFSTMALAMTVVWGAARRRGLSVVHRDDHGADGRPTNLQYSLWNIMEFTTSMALIAAVFKLASSPDSFDHRPAEQILIGFFLGIPFAALSLFMSWVLLRPRLSLALLMVLTGMLWVTCVIVKMIVYHGTGDRSVGIVLAVAMLMFASLIACRLSGYRIARRNCFDQNPDRTRRDFATEREE